MPPRAEGETSARGCFQWALLCHLEERPESAVAWLERATLLKPSDYWSQFYLGNSHELLGRDGRAMEHYQAAVALREDSPWARFNRSVIYRKRGDWEQALNDLTRALASADETDFLGARLNLGLVRQVLGDDPGARAAYESVIAAAGPGNSLARAGRLNRATIDIDAGAVDRALAEYAALLAENPRDDQALLARACSRCGSAGRHKPSGISRPCSCWPPSEPIRSSRTAPWPGSPSAGWKERRRTPPRLPPQAEPQPRTALGPDPARPAQGRRTLLAQPAG